MNSAAVPTTPDSPLKDQCGAGSHPAGTNRQARPFRLDLYDNSHFDRGASALKETLWILCKLVFFLNAIPWPARLRVALLRLFGATIGNGAVIRAGVNITFPWRFTCGDHVWIGEEVLILSLAPVTIGSHVCLSQRAFLCTGSHDWRRHTFDLKTGAIVIDESVWISAMAFVGPGTRIGSGSIVGAGCVVTTSVPKNSLVRINPAGIDEITAAQSDPPA